MKSGYVRDTVHACGRYLGLALVGVLLSSTPPALAQAPAGSLDQTFGNGGKVATKVSEYTIQRVHAIAFQRDGKIVAVGFEGGFRFVTVRYNYDGTLDQTFGSGGLVVSEFEGTGNAVAIQPDGKIVVAGREISLGDFFVARLKPDGEFDRSFGTEGIVTTDFGGYDSAQAVAILPDGKIIAAGFFNGYDDFALARYDADGSPDPTFGTAGGRIITNFSGLDYINQIVVQPDGKIVAAGATSRLSAETDFALARYNVDGSLDSSFGSSGQVTTDFMGGEDIITDLDLLSDGKLLTVGTVWLADGVGGFDFGGIGFARYNPDGSLDGTFGTQGRMAANLGLRGPYRLAIQPDGSLLVSGGIRLSDAQPGDMGILRLDARARLDATFGSSGLVTVDFFGGDDAAYCIAMQPDGKVIVGGLAVDPANNFTNYFALARVESGIPGPKIDSAAVRGKRLYLAGTNFSSSAVIVLNGKDQKTTNGTPDPSLELVGKNAGKKIQPGRTVTLQVRNADGIVSPPFEFTRPAS